MPHSGIVATSSSPFIPQSPTYQAYTSILPLIKNLLATHGSTTRATPSPDKFEKVTSILRFAEMNRPATGLAPKSNEQEICYRVEHNLWCYYCILSPPLSSSFPLQRAVANIPHFQVTTPFPSPPPPPHLLSPSLTPRALATRSALLTLLSAQKDFGPHYIPQMGWNPQTGEPWLSVRCYARNAYPAISGRYNEFAKEVERLVPEFKLFFMRFRKEQNVLIWPEFASPINLSSPSAWERFARFRWFIETWACTKGELIHINDACRKWLGTPYVERDVLDLPEGFRLDIERLEGVSASTEVQENAGAATKEYDSWRPCAGGDKPEEGIGMEIRRHATKHDMQNFDVRAPSRSERRGHEQWNSNTQQPSKAKYRSRDRTSHRGDPPHSLCRRDSISNLREGRFRDRSASPRPRFNAYYHRPSRDHESSYRNLNERQNRFLRRGQCQDGAYP